MSVVSTTSPGANPTGNVYVDGLIWGTSWNVNTSVGGPAGTITYSFADSTVSGFKTMRPYEMQAFRAALAIIESIIPIDFVEVDFLSPSGTPYFENVSFGLVTSEFLDGGLGYHQVPGDKPIFQDGFGIDTLFGFFAYDTPFFSREALVKGGEGFTTILHEILHGLGLAHPHDNGGSSSVFPGVTQPFDDYGSHGQNQGVFTIMSYNSGYAQKVPLTSLTFGGAASPMALDIAALQEIYGTTANNTGNNVYKLKDVNGPGTYWSAIWDTGGVDTISAEGLNRNTLINLNDADLSGKDAGGIPSHAGGIRGGYTIANTVVIENAIGGNKSDRILGNEVANNIQGRAGNDVMYGRAGDDTILGGNGNDTLSGDSGSDILNGGRGNDNIVSRDGDGNDVINGGENSDWIRFTGTAAAAVDLEVTTQQDTGYGLDTISGIENLSGTGQGDQFAGSAAVNVMNGGSGKDVLDGRAGNDRLNGGNHNDTLIGGGGRDTLNGGNGADTIFGGGGLDIMTGGQGADTFVFTSTRESTASTARTDEIRDFRPGVDKIDVSAIDASTVLAGDDEFVFRGQKPFGVADRGEIYYKKIDAAGTANDRTYVYIDTDGDRAPEMVIELSGLHNLTADDFIL